MRTRPPKTPSTTPGQNGGTCRSHPACRASRSGTSKADLRALARWAERVNAIYPEGWLEAGGPIRTQRGQYETRHVPDRTPYGGYDMAVPAPGEEGE